MSTQIGERGYVSFGERFYGYLFTELPQDPDLALLCPLYAAQDIACGESRIFYHVYSSSARDQLSYQIISRMNSTSVRCQRAVVTTSSRRRFDVVVHCANHSLICSTANTVTA